MARWAISNGHTVSVACGLAEGVSLSGWPEQIEFTPLAMETQIFQPAGDLRLIKSIGHLVTKFRPDVVHFLTIKPILYGGLALSVLVPAKQRRSILSVWTFAGLGKVFEPSTSPFRWLRRTLIANVLKLTGRLTRSLATFENSGDCERLVSFGCVPKARAYEFMGTGLDLDSFHYDPKIKAERLKVDPRPIVLMATRLINEKGVDTFLEVAASFKAQGQNVRFLLAGLPVKRNSDAVDIRDIERAVERGEIEFLGGINQDEMPKLLNEADIFCLPTRLLEGFPRALLEAAAGGCALIGSDQPTIRRLIIPKETGWVLPYPDGQSLEACISSALDDIDRTRQFGKNAVDLVHSLPITNKAVLTKIFDVYQDNLPSNDR